MKRQQEPTLNFTIARCRVNPSDNRLECEGRDVVLEPRVMDLLVTLSARPDHVFSRDELVESVWAGRLVSDEAVNRAVFELRKAFRSLGVRREVIATVRKRGYRLKRTPRPLNGPASRKILYPALIAASVSLVVLLSWLVFRDESNRPRTTPQEEIVLEMIPIATPSGDESAPVFANLLGESLSESLAQQEGLLVRLAANESGSFQILPFLHPDYRLDGSLTPQPGGYTLVLSLESGAGAKIWSDSLEINSLPDRVAASMASVSKPIAMALVQHFRQAESCKWTDDITTLESYFKAQQLISLRGEQNIREAIQNLKFIIESAPNFARAWSMLAWAYGLLPAHIEDRVQAAREAGVLDPLADQAAQRAIEICPALAEAYMRVGSPTGYNGDNEKISHELTLRRALELDPGNAEITRHYADILFRWGKLEDSKRLMKRALELNPYNARTYRDLAEHAINDGDLALAAQLLGEADRLGYSGKRYAWWRLHVLNGDREALMSEAPDPLLPVMELLADALADPGNEKKRAAAVTALSEAHLTAPHDGRVLAYFAGVWLEDNDLAWSSHNAIDLRANNLHGLWWPESASFRTDPQFDTFWKQMDLFEYWRFLGPPDECQVRENAIDCDVDS